MKAIKYKMELIMYVRLFVQRKPLRLAIIQNMSCVYEKSVKHVKNQTNLLFLWKTGVEASKIITKSFKVLDFLKLIPFDDLPWNH